MNIDNDKSDHHLIVADYESFNLLDEGLFMPVCSFLTLFLIYQKLNDNLMTFWQVAFIPLYIYLGITFLTSFIKIIRLNGSEDKVKLKIHNFELIALLSTFFRLLIIAIGVLSIYYLAEFLDRKEDDLLIYSIYCLALVFKIQILYGLLRKLNTFKIKREKRMDLERNDEEETANKSDLTAFLGSLTGPILTYFSNMMIICNNGACTQIYASTITSLLGAFGVTVSDFSEYLFPITCLLLTISVYSLYSKRRKITHKPFLLGVFSCFLIIISHFVESLSILTWPGNILMITAAIWNAKLNKFSGLPTR